MTPATAMDLREQWLGDACHYQDRAGYWAAVSRDMNECDLMRAHAQTVAADFHREYLNAMDWAAIYSQLWFEERQVS